jgi:thiamine pyrophosphokinase
LDQTLANLFHLLRPELEALDVRFDDGREEIFLIREAGCLTGSEGDIVSLIPLLGICEGVSTEGLRYPLSNETLYPERTRGISNRMLGESARVSLAQGVLMCIHTRKHLKFGHFPPLAEQLQNGIVN